MTIKSDSLLIDVTNRPNPKRLNMLETRITTSSIELAKLKIEAENKSDIEILISQIDHEQVLTDSVPETIRKRL